MPVPFLTILASAAAAAAVRCPASVEAFVPSLAGQQRPSPFSLSSTVSPAPKSIGSSAADDNGGNTNSINAANELDAEFDPEHMARDPSAEAAAARNRGRKKDKRSHQQQHHHENDIDLMKYKSIIEFNEELDKLAKRCLDDRPGGGEDVIGLAALAEGMLHRLQHLVRDADNEGDWASVDHIIRPDVVTVNTVINVSVAVAG